LGLVHARHLLVAFDTNPDKKGIAVGYRQQGALALTHANLGLAQAKAGNLAGAKTHAEHVVNIIEGSKGANFGDLDKDGATGNPGDGFGVLPYADDTVKHANLAQTAAGGDDVFDTYAPMAVASANAAKSKVTLARDTVLPVLGATETTIASLYLTNVVAVLTKAVNGIDANGDGVIEATAAEGGINQAYWSAQKTATISVAPGAPKPPATGDIGYGSIALIALAGGLVLFAGGAFLYRRNRAYSHR
jgi:LPXTG-motif cell wall-anchored protein